MEEYDAEIWIECDRCGRVFGGPGVFAVIQERATSQGRILVCSDCVALRVSQSRLLSDRDRAGSKGRLNSAAP